MHLVLDTPASWKVAPRDDGARAFAVDDTVEMIVAPIVKMPSSAHAWHVKGLALFGPEGTTAVEVESADDETNLGWPVRVTEATVQEGDAVTEHRLICYYRLLEYSCIAVARAAEAGDLDAHREELLRVLMTGRPHWKTDEVASIHELWQGLDWEG